MHFIRLNKIAFIFCILTLVSCSSNVPTNNSAEQLRYKIIGKWGLEPMYTTTGNYIWTFSKDGKLFYEMPNATNPDATYTVELHYEIIGEEKIRISKGNMNEIHLVEFGDNSMTFNNIEVNGIPNSGKNIYTKIP